MAVSVKQSIRKSAKNSNAKYKLTYRTVYSLKPTGTNSYRYTQSKSVNLSYKGT